MRPSSLNPRIVAREIDTPVRTWPGNCFAIAAAMIREGIVEGGVVYGTYCGPVHPESRFENRPIISHGWIRQEDRILDPTRWTLTRPYHPVILAGTAFGEYDPGGQALRKKIRAAQSAPKWASIRAEHDLSRLSGSAQRRSKRILRCHRQKITTAQLNWLANAPLEELGDDAEEIYRWIGDLGHSAFIPVDHQAMVLGRDAGPSAYDYARAK